ncbi:MAG: FG-GAP-like repeat-containing protein [bacterium]
MNKRIKSPAVAALMLVLIWLPFSTVGQDLGAEPIWIGDTEWSTEHVEVADLNGDEIPDVITGEYNSTYYGSPGHVFAFDGKTGDTLWLYPINDGARSMTIGDLNDDGIADVIVGAAYNAGDTPDGYVHAIDGSTGLALWTFYVGATIQTVCVGNFNGDAYLDVAAGTFDDYVYAINGQTGSQLWRRLIGSLWINAVDAEDVNDDGIEDVAYAHEYLTNFTNRIGVLNGTNGSFLWDDTVAYVNLDAMIADVDGDDTLEAVFAVIDGSDQGHITVRNALTGAEEWIYDLGSINHTNGELGLHWYDIDNDLDNDVVISNNLGWRRIIALDGTGPSLMFQSDSLDSYPRDLAFGDVTDDGNLEIVAAAFDRVQVVSAVDGSKIWYYAVGGSIRAVACGDFDDDKITDVAAVGSAEASGTPPNPAKTVWALRTARSPLWWEHQFGQYGNAIAIADIDGDEYMDVLAVASLDDWVWALRGVEGDDIWHWTGTENLYAVTAGDFNGDGQMDVAVGGNDDMVTAVDGANGLMMWQFTDPGDQIYRKCLVAADLNADDNVDVIAGSDDGDIYAIDGSSGTKATTLWVAPYSGGQAEEVELADMNGTGPIDIVAVTGGRLVVLDGANGSELWYYDVGTANARACEVLDANDDGVLDVAVAISSPGQVVLIDGVSHTTLWVFPCSPSIDYTLSHALCDDDKAEDVIIAGNSTSKTIYAVDGMTGTALWTLPTGSEVNCVLGGDINGDGQDDVMAGGDDNIVRAIDGMTGEVFFEYSTAGDVMQLALGDVSGDGALNLACVTFGSDGIVYVFNSMYEASCCVGFTGNIDADPGDEINIADLVYLVNYMFNGGPVPACWDEVDIDGNGAGPDIADLVYLVNYMFNSGPLPADCP